MDNENELSPEPIMDEPGAFPMDGDANQPVDPDAPRYLLLKITQRAFTEIDDFPVMLAAALDQSDIGDVDVIELEPDLIEYIESQLEG